MSKFSSADDVVFLVSFGDDCEIICLILCVIFGDEIFIPKRGVSFTLACDGVESITA